MFQTRNFNDIALDEQLENLLNGLIWAVFDQVKESLNPKLDENLDSDDPDDLKALFAIFRDKYVKKSYMASHKYRDLASYDKDDWKRVK